MFSLYQTLSLRYLLRNRTRTLLVILSIALGVGTWVATELLMISVRKSVRSASTPLGGAADYHVINTTVRSVDAGLAERLRKVEGVHTVQTLVIEPVKVQAGDGKAAAPPEPRQVTATIVGVSLSGPAVGSRQQLLDDLKAWGIEINEPDLNAFMLAAGMHRVFPSVFPPPALVGQRLDEEELGSDGKFRVAAGGKTHTMLRAGQVRADGPAASLGGYVVLTDADTAATLLEMPGRATRLDVVLEPGADRERAARDLQRALADTGADLQSPQTQDERMTNVIRGIQSAFQICGVGALVVGMFLVYNALSVGVAERRHEIGILRSLGATRGQVRMLFVCEGLVMGLAGALVGLPLGVGLAHIALGVIHDLLQGFVAPAEASDMALPAGPFVRALLAGVCTALGASLVPASQASAEEPVDVVRRTPAHVAALVRVLHAAGSVLVFGAGMLLVVARPYLTSDALAALSEYSGIIEPTFLGSGLMLLGSILATPLLAALLTRVLQPLVGRVLPLESRLAMDNLVREPGRTGVVIGALAACIALMIQTAGTIRSSEVAYSDWLDQTMQADLVVTGGGPLSASGGGTLDGAVAADVQKELPANSRLVGHCYRMVDWEGIDGETKVFLTMTDALAHYEANKTRVADKDQLELYRRLGTEPNTAIVSQNFALQQKIDLEKNRNTTITLKGTTGQIHLRVIGVVVDYSWSRGTIMVDRQGHLDSLRARRADSFEVYCPPGTDVAAARQRLQQSEAGSKHSLMVYTRGEVRDSLLDAMRRIYSTQYPQEVLVGLVAVLGVVMSLLISVLSRRRELGLLRAVGGTRGQLLHTVLAEACLVGVVGTLLGILLGLPLLWWVVHVVVFAEAGFLFPVQIPWLATLVIAVLAVACATVAGLGPAVQAMRLRIADAIAYE